MKIGIIGGGASGMMAAIVAARSGGNVTLFERNEDCGKKILATGNGKCNLGNMNLDVAFYYCDEPDRLSDCFSFFGTQDTLSFFSELGLMTKDKNGYLYPYGEQASTVVRCLKNGLTDLGVTVIGGALVKEIHPLDAKNFSVSYEKSGQNFTEIFDRIILSTGGNAAPKTGSDGWGYKTLHQLGIPLHKTHPALTSLYCKEKWYKDMAGVRAKGRVSLLVDGTVLGEDVGEIQLTEYGVSGIPVFAISRLASEALSEKREVSVSLDFFPDYTLEQLLLLGEARKKKLAGRKVDAFFAGTLNQKIVDVLLKLSGISAEDSLSQVLQYAPHKLTRFWEMSKALKGSIFKTGSYETAQVTAGGCPLTELNDSLELKSIPGMYVVGELVDVDGVCGGYNLQWAWTSGYIAGKEASRA